ncbi:hypothetical protein [Bradyrhizobium ottawaense]|uniref:Uncharacterized protein n=1 Tax=Bradyrhizobium ottawaense TaxID=931866 RepID=A0ABY0QH93_9BRAD|nr:hypothetical protein [Bradyrhizobium ottawaense]SDK42606.1 hypothetical protein SAMN05444163_8081 [Bradyrhizobium ottawaense]
MKIIGISAAMAVAWAATAQANAFDDCVLKNMQGATSDVAAKSIKVACIRKSSVTLTDDDLKGLKVSNGFYGTFGMMRTPGFTAEVKNNTGFIVTEITFAITIGDGPAEMYRVDNFNYQEPGVIYTGPAPDPTFDMRIDPLKSKKFQFEMDRREIEKKKKWGWSLVGAKGIVSQ